MAIPEGSLREDCGLGGGVQLCLPRIIVVLDSLDESYQGDVLRGICSGLAGRTSLRVLVAPRTLCDSNTLGQVLKKRLVAEAADGVILLAGALRLTEEQLRSLAASVGSGSQGDARVVSVGLTTDVTASVAVKDEDGIHSAVRHLIEVHTFREIGFLCGPPGHAEACCRLEAFRNAMPPELLKEEYIIPDGNFTFTSGQAAASKLLRVNRNIEAMIAANDEMARGALCAIDEECTSDQQPAVIGFDDSQYAVATHPALTTVRQPAERAGQLAARMVLELCAGRTLEQRKVVLPTELQVRRSCHCPAASGRVRGKQRSEAISLLEHFVTEPSDRESLYRQFVGAFKEKGAAQDRDTFFQEASAALKVRLPAATMSDIGVWQDALFALRDAALTTLADAPVAVTRDELEGFWQGAAKSVNQRGKELALKMEDQRRVLQEMLNVPGGPMGQAQLDPFLHRLGISTPDREVGADGRGGGEEGVAKPTSHRGTHPGDDGFPMPDDAEVLFVNADEISLGELAFPLGPPSDWWIYGEIVARARSFAALGNIDPQAFRGPPRWPAGGEATRRFATVGASHEDAHAPLGRTLSECKSYAGTALATLKNAIPFDSASIQLVDDDARSLLVGNGFDEQSPNRFLLRPVSLDPLVSRIIKSREPYFCGDLSREDDWNTKIQGAPAEDTVALKSWIGAPIVVRGTPVGFLTLDFREAQPQLERHRGQVLAFLEQVTPYVEKAVPLAKIEQGAQISQIVRRIVQMIGEMVEQGPLLQTIVNEVVKHLNCRTCRIFFPKWTDGQIEMAAAYSGGTEDAKVGKFMEDEGFAGEMYKHDKSVRLDDIFGSHAFVKPSDLSLKTRSILAVPIQVGRQTIGLICADQDAPSWFTRDDQYFLEALAQQAGIAIQRSQSLQFFQDISETILSQDDRAEILKKVVDRAVTLVNGTTGVIYYLSQDKSTVCAFHPASFHHPPPRLENPQGLTRTIVDQGQVIAIPNIAKDARVNPDLIGKVVSLVGVPLKRGGKAIGALFVDDMKERDFTESERSLLAILASQAAMALEKASLLKDLDERVKRHEEVEGRLERLHTIVRGRKLEEAIDRVGEGAIALLGDAVSVTVNLYSEDAKEFLDCYPYGPLKDFLRNHPRKDGVGSYVVHAKAATYHTDVNEPPAGCPAMREEGRKLGVISFAAVPMLTRDRVTGVLYVNSQRHLAFTESERRLLELFAVHAGIAVDNSREFEKVQDWFRTFSAKTARRMTQHIKTYSLQETSLSTLATEPIIDPDGVKRVIAALGETTTQVKSWLNSLIRLEKRPKPILTPVTVDELVQSARAAMADECASCGVELEYRPGSAGAKQISCDPALINECFSHLLKNALRAVGGRLDRRIVIIAESSGVRRTAIWIEDNGPGLPPGMPVGDPILDADHDVIGVGLAIVQQIMRAHGGNLEYGRSAELGGASVTMRFRRE